MIVIDSSAMVAALTDDTAHGEHARGVLIQHHVWHAPHHLYVEVTSAVRGRVMGRKITPQRGEAALETLNNLSIAFTQWRDIAKRVWQLRDNLAPYDAAFIAVAEREQCRVVTADSKLYNCSVRLCDVEVISTA